MLGVGRKLGDFFLVNITVAKSKEVKLNIKKKKKNPWF
jgi:hypothetical protein